MKNKNRVFLFCICLACILICFIAIDVRLSKNNIVLAIVLGIIVLVITVICIIFYYLKRKFLRDLENDVHINADYLQHILPNINEAKIELKSSNAELIELISEYNKNNDSEVEKDEDL